MIELERVTLTNRSGDRAYWMTHSHDGLLRPLRWEALLEDLRPLEKRIHSRPGDVILGLDGPGMIPAVALGALLSLPVVFATKADLARSPKLEFAEPSSPRPRVFVYGLRPNMSVILVDDGVTSGRTLESCIKVLQQQRITIRAVVAIVESRKRGARERLRAQGYTLISLTEYAG